MTIEEMLNEQIMSLNLDNLTEAQHEWLHWVKTLFTWAWVSKTRRELLNERATGKHNREETAPNDVAFK